MLLDFPQLVKTFLSALPDRDFPVLDSRLFFSCWLALIMDKSTVSMQDLFKRLNRTGIPVDISTFSKACKSRSLQMFEQLYRDLLARVRRELPVKQLHPCPIDSTVVGLTSKLLWAQSYHQVKLLACLEHGSGATEGSLINFGYDHDSNFVNEMLQAIPENGVGIFDRGFAGLEYLKNAQASSKYFLMRIPSNYKFTFEGNAGQMRVGTGKESGMYRVVNFCDIENRAEYRLVTNLPAEGECFVSDEEVMELYRQRWQIELLWKFLKMHLKLKRLMTKNENGIRMQLYVTLIAHLLLELVAVPKMWGSQRLDKLRYLQCCMCKEISYVHWLGKLLGSRRRRVWSLKLCANVY
ncbi:IS4-like element ISGvi4 family transposase [Gloeobacter violaceus]|uniref:Glr0761 protein n=1 Tax=Gloeobacter violaceus (strain ATCC 29082 / PCC 7421) TaxID=251221 RepID=Q7NMK4_GLOVI|nr:IS4-like element ISGvi4 family transposase [Gloeobacter violaceus]BAC88702.1 glr0761 [Gloeobacter violaceus PCC 7421]